VTKQYFFTLSETAAKLEISEHAVVDLAHQERLPICFKYKGEISAVGVHSLEGSTEQIRVLRFNGILRAMQPPADDENLGGYAVLVEIVRADGLRYTTEQAGRGRRLLPTPTEYGGYILPGYNVVGFAEDVDVPCGKWLFHADDLAKLTADATPSGPVVKVEPVWSVKRSITRFPGYRKPLYDFLKAAYVSGQICPKARDILDDWKRELPPEVHEVLHDSVKYYDGKGNIKIVNLKAIGQAINGLTKK
jgi:hypothetical protein